jgi:hypothetical protein
MKDLVWAVLADYPGVSLEELDISTDRELVDRYGLDIPVLMIDGKKAAKYRVTREELKRMIEGRRRP